MEEKMKEFRKKIGIALGLFLAFLLWTAAVCWVDVQAIGPQESSVGLATFNRAVHAWTGVHFALYTVTDWLGLVPLGICAGFGVLGLMQWIRRKSLRDVDCELLVLGGFWVAVLVAYLFFECVPVNFRPVLIDGALEVSYPSSTTVLALCVVPEAGRFWGKRMRNRVGRRIVLVMAWVLAAFLVIGRIVSGVHWMSDILGGVLLSAALVAAYLAVEQRIKEKGE